MENLHILREFNEFYEDFQNANYNLQTVSRILVSIREHKYDLTHQQIKSLLNIPINVMEHDVEISDESEFAGFGGYFSRNITIKHDEVLNELQEKFRLKQHQLQDMIFLTKYVQENIEEIGSDIEFILRNPEVTIRDDVKLLSYSNFNKSGKVFAKQIQKAMDIQTSNDEIMRKSRKPKQPNTVLKETKHYDIALSFAGEDRSYAAMLAEELKSCGVYVFYDEYEKADLWGKDLYSHLSTIYKDKAQFCVVFTSKNYAIKAWTSHEIRNAQARAFKEKREYILPLRLDDTEIPGITETVGYIDWRKHDTKKIAQLLQVKLLKIKNHL